MRHIQQEQNRVCRRTLMPGTPGAPGLTACCSSPRRGVTAPREGSFRRCGRRAGHLQPPQAGAGGRPRGADLAPSCRPGRSRRLTHGVRPDGGDEPGPPDRRLRSPEKPRDTDTHMDVRSLQTMPASAAADHSHGAMYNTRIIRRIHAIFTKLSGCRTRTRGCGRGAGAGDGRTVACTAPPAGEIRCPPCQSSGSWVMPLPPGSGPCPLPRRHDAAAETAAPAAAGSWACRFAGDSRTAARRSVRRRPHGRSLRRRAPH